MKTSWKLQDAKAKFSQVVDEANGPQYVTRHGAEAVVILSVEEFEELKSSKPSFKDFLLSCPKASLDLDLTRPKDLPRRIDL
jgi:prevent-host-death family protein